VGRLAAFARVGTHTQVELRWPLPDGVTASTKQRVKWTQAGVERFFGITAIGEPDNRMQLIVLSCSELVGERRGG
jgi:hypothetical protein